MASIKLGQKFSSYADLETAVERFSEETYSLFTKIESKKLEMYKDQYRRIRLAPPELVYYLITYRCIAWGKLKRRSTNRIRKSTGTFRQGCEARMTVCLSRDAQHLEVTFFKMEHNHVVSKELYESLPRVRLKLPKPLKDKIRRDLDQKVRKDYLIEEIFKETGKRLTYRDLTNIHYHWKNARKVLQKSSSKNEEEENNRISEQQVPSEIQSENLVGFENVSTFEPFNSPGVEEMQSEPQSGESAFETTDCLNSPGLVEAQPEVQGDQSVLPKNVLQIPSAILVYCNETTKENNILKTSLTKNNVQIEEGTLKELIETQRDTNREIKKMNNHLSDIVQVLKRMESKLSSNANIV